MSEQELPMKPLTRWAPTYESDATHKRCGCCYGVQSFKKDILQLSPRVIRILGKNPGPFTLQGTNTYLLGTGKKKILIDTGEANVADYLQNLATALGNENQITTIIATHWHHDHIGGITGILRRFPDNNNEKIRLMKCQRFDGKSESTENAFEFVENGQQIEVEGATLRIIFTPGHTSDHISLWLEEEKALFSGDCVLGEGSAVFENLTEYLRSLRKLLELDPVRIYPGHGPVIDNPREKVNEYIEHRLQREKEILKTIREEQPVSAIRIASMLYPNILPTRRMGSLFNVRHHLAKLVSDGSIVNVGIGFGLYKLAEEKDRKNQSNSCSIL
ncbi:hypothetical protein niasHT_030174 [Heterodera trifolii]|uniref:Beta-lactamase-like protein 2 homolog n=1 Tax=Heterodera trifolii TaxID=157864 RepID=A0ABD2K3F0_9BILA